MQLPSVSMQEPDLANIETKKVGTPNKKKGKSTLRKAPQAPKRFKSSYILFFVHVQVKIKAELGGRASVRALFISSFIRRVNHIRVFVMFNLYAHTTFLSDDVFITKQKGTVGIEEGIGVVESSKR